MEGPQRESVILDAEESRCFWSDIWDQAVVRQINKTQTEHRLVEEGGEQIRRASSTRWHTY